MNKINHLFSRLLDNSISENELKELLGKLDQPGSESRMNRLMEIHWEEVKDKIGPAQMDEETKSRFLDVLRNSERDRVSGSPPLNVASSDRNRYTRWWAVAASVLILISAGVFWTVRMDFSVESLPVTELATTQYTGKQVVNLPDGSTVILNEGSRLSFSESFGKEKREIQFSGEGYFDIAHDPDRSFLIHTGEVTTTVLGTAFNLMAYEDQPRITVAVERGEVAVGDENRLYEKILPSEQLVVNKRTRKYEKEAADLSKVLAWKDQFLILAETTIEEAAELIGARYHLQVKIRNEEVRNCLINAAFMHGETIDQVLRVICGVLQAEYSRVDNTVEIIGGRKCE